MPCAGGGVSAAVAALAGADGDHVSAKPDRRGGEAVGVGAAVAFAGRRVAGVGAAPAAVVRLRRACGARAAAVGDKVASARAPV